MRTLTPVKLATIGLLSSVLVFGSGVGAGASSSSSSTLAQAKKYVLTLSAMPKGWKVEKGSTYSKGSSNNFPGATTLAKCIGVPSNLITSNPPEEDSPYYQNKDGSLEVQDAVTIFPSGKRANASYGAISNPKTPACYAAVVNTPAFKNEVAAGGGAGTSVGTVTVTKAAHLEKHTGGFTMTIPITAQGGTVSVHETQVFYVKGRLGHQVTFTSYGVPFPTSVMEHVTSEAKRSA